MTTYRRNPHLSPEELAARALDGPDGTWVLEEVLHLFACRQCHEQLTEFERAMTAGRDADISELFPSPPPRVWEAIRAEIRAERAARAPENIGLRRWRPDSSTAHRA
ncbi:anti-sigma factor [Streptomyces triticiradicis]|uniref:Anti-sigma factor n=1 Tax=Streptomyces triticiradicis TaxID=2651189 RepID=A0A7J5D2K5_9ACTN|nr:anti-sigma factor [Streptomyces triticiradicis]KAB1976672.1 anti-sigma factor [Streptomyces triticiradicis]